MMCAIEHGTPIGIWHDIMTVHRQQFLWFFDRIDRNKYATLAGHDRWEFIQSSSLSLSLSIPWIERRLCDNTGMRVLAYHTILLLLSSPAYCKIRKILPVVFSFQTQTHVFDRMVRVMIIREHGAFQWHLCLSYGTSLFFIIADGAACSPHTLDRVYRSRYCERASRICQ